MPSTYSSSTGPIRTTSPSRAPASRQRLLDAHACGSRCWTYTSASSLVRSAIATTRSARPAATPPGAVVVAHDREALLRRAVAPRTAPARAPPRAGLVDERAEPAEELVEPLVGDGGDAAGRRTLVGGDVGLAADDEARPVEQLGPVAAQLVEQDRSCSCGRAPVDGREVEQHARAPGPARRGAGTGGRAPALGRTLDQAGDVGEHELVVAEAHDAEVAARAW